MAAAVALGVVAAVPATRAADTDGNAYTVREQWFPSGDGTMLHADVLLPADHVDGERHPVILSIGPYFARGGPTPTLRFADLIEGGRIFEEGYAWVQVDSRGYGASGGCNDFGGPGEQSDTKAAVEWAADQAWSTGKVGMWGKSYDAWTQVMALAQKPRGLAAAVIQAPLLETYRGLYMNGVHYSGGWFGTPAGYADYDLEGSTYVDGEPDRIVHPATGTATNPQCYAANLAMTTASDRSLPYWRERDIVDAAASSDVPVLWSHGVNDIHTKPDNFLDVYRRLQGPKRVWFGQWDHVRGNEAALVGRKGFLDEAMRWFDEHLRGAPAAADPGAVIQDGNGRWRSEAQWPPADVREHAFDLLPGAYWDGAGYVGTATGLVTFTTPAPHDVHIAGEALAELDLEGPPGVPANVIVRVWDLDGRHATLVTRGAHSFVGAQSVDLKLFPQDWVLRAGHRLVVELSGGDQLWQTVPSGDEVMLTGGRLVLPVLSQRRANDLTGGPARAQEDVLRRTYVADPARTTSSAFPPPLR